MRIIVVGISHKTAPIEVREQFYLNGLEQDFLLSLMKNQAHVAEAFILSTCNRTEVYAGLIEGHGDGQCLMDALFTAKRKGINDSLRACFYVLWNEQAVEHLFRVACGMDSQVLGEKEILGQVKASFSRASEKAMLGRSFHILSNFTLRTGKKARHETAISIGGSSVSWAAVKMAEDLCGSFRTRNILVIGAGKMGETGLHQMKKRGAERLFVMNRTRRVAEEMAQKFSATAVEFCDIKETLERTDICLCSAGAPHFILEDKTVSKVMARRRERPLLIMDISVPRNVNPAAGAIPNVLLYSIDDLDTVVDANMKLRQSAVAEAEHIIQDELQNFLSRINEDLYRILPQRKQGRC